MLDVTRKSVLTEALRQAARDQVMPRFRQLGAGDVSTKSGPADLVTLADTEAERQFGAAVRAAWPEAEVLGEESVAADPRLRARMAEADWAVVVDPVDGTWNYAKGLTLFGMILSVFRRGEPVWGLLYDPVMDDWIEAEAGGAARMTGPDGRARDLRTSAERREGRMVGYVTLGLFPKAQQARIAAELPAYSRATSLRCACHEYRMVAQGHAEFCISGPVPHPWDHGAGVLAVIAAGGKAAFLDGTPYGAARREGVVLSASSAEVWDMVARRFAYLG